MKKRARLTFSGGRITSDFNTNKPMPNFFNSISTLFFMENYKKLYQKDFIKIAHSFDPTNGLNLNIGGEYADRKQLYNTTDFTLIKWKDKEYSSNVPTLIDSSNSFIFGDNKATIISATLTYTPKQPFKYKKDEKWYYIFNH